MNADTIPEKLYLVCETPENFGITVNGKAIDKTTDRDFRNKGISGHLRTATQNNPVVLDGNC